MPSPVFFELEKLIHFLLHNKEQIAVFDESILGLMASEWNSEYHWRSRSGIRVLLGSLISLEA
jgi:hypothetical protein